ncbi:MAG: nucleotidyltransferase family protein, partial [Candidatus Ornithomonoglobus sp.]
NGYVVDEFDEMEIHDGYRKPPHILIEVHNRLVEKSNRAYNYYSKIWDEVKLKEGTKHCFEMSKECFYAFIIAHLCKHIKNEGAGIKFICDIWVLNKVYGSSFDRKELTKILNIANITDFEAMARELAEYWFSDRYEVSDDVLALEKFVLESGCFGTKENYKKIRASIAADDAGELAKYRYKRFMSNVFVPYSKLKKNYPILKKCCVLLPFIWIFRLFRILCDGNKSIGDRLNATFTIDAEESGKLKNLWNAVN